LKNNNIKELAQKHFKNKKCANSNKDRIIDILHDIEGFKVDFYDIRFGDGYFVFSFEPNSVAWFFIKEFPDWKFGIWLNGEGSYSVFGEAITLIDKFKPSASSLSKENIFDFNKELFNILNNVGEWKEYNLSVEESKERDRLSLEYNQKNFERILKYIKQTQKDFNNGLLNGCLDIEDRNTKDFKVLPRYIIHIVSDTQKYFKTEEYKEYKKKFFNDLCGLLIYSGLYNMNSRIRSLDIDEYLFSNLSLENPKDFIEKANLYNYNYNTIEDYFTQVS